MRFNAAKLLLDPYARAIDGVVRFGPEVLGHAVGDPDPTSALDSASTRRAASSSPGRTGAARSRPWHRFADTVIYEVHVQGPPYCSLGWYTFRYIRSIDSISKVT